MSLNEKLYGFWLRDGCNVFFAVEVACASAADFAVYLICHSVINVVYMFAFVRILRLDSEIVSLFTVVILYFNSFPAFVFCFCSLTVLTFVIGYGKVFWVSGMIG